MKPMKTILQRFLYAVLESLATQFSRNSIPLQDNSLKLHKDWNNSQGISSATTKMLN